jgi:antitoxin HicB
MAKARYRYNIMLRPEPEGGYTALVPALPGCVTYGRTLKEAQEMANDAISGYIASLRKHPNRCPPTKKRCYPLWTSSTHADAPTCSGQLIPRRLRSNILTLHP